MSTAAERWAAQLQGWEIPEEILAAAPESPWGFDVATFAEAADAATHQEAAEARPSYRLARAALPAGGRVLDLGSGVGAASLPLAQRAGELVAVDTSADMLAAFAERAEAAGVAARTIAGRWPSVAEAAPVSDVVLAYHVVHNVANLQAFAAAAHQHARKRVVIELADGHPLAWTAPYWQALHGLDRPAGPTAADAAAVLIEAGLPVTIERWSQPSPWSSHSSKRLVTFLRKRLCLSPARDDELAEAIASFGVPVQWPVAAVWWDTHESGDGTEP